VTISDDFHTDDERRRDLLIGEALGILDGRDRAAVLAHVAHCDRCAEELSGFVATADDVISAVPGAEPSVGFESAVMARIESESRTRRRSRPTAAVLSVAAVVIALALGVGVLIGQLASPPEPKVAIPAKMVEAPLIEGGHAVGAVYASSGSPGWLVVTVEAKDPAVTVHCLLRTADSTKWLGTFTLGPPVASWSVPLPVPLASVRGVTLTLEGGAVLATTKSLAAGPTYGA
jgi:hypothetical protein